jgi:hypothetical protein
MQICFFFPSLKNEQNNSQFRGMYASFFKAVENLGVKVSLVTNLDQIEGDILGLIIGGGFEPYAAKAMHVFKGPVILYVHHAYICFYKSFLKRWRSRILFAYSTDFANLTYNKYASVDIAYYHIPFASDEAIFYPLNLEKRYDIVFLGNANSGYGRDRYIDLLIKYVKKNNLEILLAGNGWEKYGYPYQLIVHGKLLNIVYNLGKICVNIHNDRQFLGMEYEMDANNRVFDLALAGCFQVSNGENMIIKYFEKDEVVTADDPHEWIKKIDYYLKDNKKREEICIKARAHAIKEHTWHFRACDFIEIINKHLSNYNPDHKVSLLVKILRFSDQYILPTYRYKEIRIVRRLLKILGVYKQV